MRSLLTILLVVLLAPTFAQIKVIKLDEWKEGERPPCEPSIAISMKDRDNIVAGAILDKVYSSTDGGETWTTTRLESPYGVYGDPVVISDKKGDFYYFHLSDPTGRNWASEEILDRIVVQKSKDGGLTWSEGSYMGMHHPKDQDKEWAVVDLKSNNIYATWTQFDKYGSKKPTDRSNILFSKSSNGTKWSDAIKINQHSGNCLDDDQTTEGAVPAVGFDGKIFVAWAYDEKIYLDRSYDEGKTWLKNDIEIMDQPGGWDIDIPGLYRCNGMPILLSDVSGGPFTGRLYLNWADQRNGEDDTDIWFAFSNNRGDHWSSPVRVNDDEPGKHQFFSWATIDQSNGMLYVIYYDRRAYDDHRTDVYVAYSNNGGKSFKNLKISDTPFKPRESVFFGDYTNIAAFKNRIAAIWTRQDDGKNSIWAAIIELEDLEKLTAEEEEEEVEKEDIEGKN